MNDIQDQHNTVPSHEREVPLRRYALALTAIALALGLTVEVLFHDHPMGVSVPLWAASCVAALFGAAKLVGAKPAKTGFVIPILILFFALMAFVRQEPLTSFLNLTLTLALFALWVRSFRERLLFEYGWLDFGVALALTFLQSWIRPWPVLGSAGRKLFGEKRGRSRLAGVLRGLLLAIPVLVVFVALLRSADLVFAGYVDAALGWLDLARLGDWAGRAVVVITSGVFFLGALAVALAEPSGRRLIGKDSPILQPFLGVTEALTVLGVVDALFMVFVGLQVRYLFGGRANITAAGFTYSEYARRGFGELVGVGLLALALILALATCTKRPERRQQRWFNGLSGALVGLVTVILASAFMRLLLYEQAYGFTRLRTYTHVAIVWMGLLFIAFLGLLLANRLRRFAVAAVIGLLGFGATINVLNVDAFIVHHNMARYAEQGQIDLDYVLRLSDDAVPELVRLTLTAQPDIASELLPLMACRQAITQDRQQRLEWPSFHVSRAAAVAALERVQVAWQDFQVVERPSGRWEVLVDGYYEPCIVGDYVD
ncbi:MAG: DUF4173 domain-containing protein [Anaerolineales bacterium]